MHQPVDQNEIPTLVECVRCADARWGKSRACPLCAGLGMTTIEARNAWQAERLKSGGSGQYRLATPSQDDTAKREDSE